MADDGETVSSTGRYKVQRIINRYGLDGMGQQLEDRWLGNNGEAESLRDLADELNLKILQSAVEAVGQVMITSELETMYEVLMGDSSSSADRTKVRRDLERAGIDVDRLENDFVTHQAIYTYLTKGRGVSKETETRDPIESSQETINRLRSRTELVTESEIERLSSRSAISIGTFDTLVTITVACQDCGTHLDVSTLLSEQSCQCDRAPPEPSA